MPAGEPTAEEEAETRRAIWWVVGCVVVLGLIFAVASSFVSEDAYLARLGRYKELRFVLEEVQEVERERDYADAPVTWIVGSSITRDAFDAESIEARMREAGSDHRVAKFAFNRGAPIFSQAIVDDLPLRRGDRVVTTVAEGNFRWAWLEEVANFDLYVETVLDPVEILSLQDTSLANRFEWALANAPPAQFFKNQGDFRRGIVKTYKYWLGLRKKPRPRINGPYQPFISTDRTLRSSKLDWGVPADEVVLGPGQTNWDGLAWLAADCEARGVELYVLYLPGHPRLYKEFVEERTVDAMQDHFDAREDLHFIRLHPRAHPAYYDYKHPNNTGRPWFSRDLADILLQEEGLPTPPRDTPDPTLAKPGEVPARLYEGVRP